MKITHCVIFTSIFGYVFGQLFVSRNSDNVGRIVRDVDTTAIDLEVNTARLYADLAYDGEARELFYVGNGNIYRCNPENALICGDTEAEIYMSGKVDGLTLCCGVAIFSETSAQGTKIYATDRDGNYVKQLSGPITYSPDSTPTAQGDVRITVNCEAGLVYFTSPSGLFSINLADTAAGIQTEIAYDFQDQLLGQVSSLDWADSNILYMALDIGNLIYQFVPGGTDIAVTFEVPLASSLFIVTTSITRFYYTSLEINQGTFTINLNNVLISDTQDGEVTAAEETAQMLQINRMFLCETDHPRCFPGNCPMRDIMFNNDNTITVTDNCPEMKCNTCGFCLPDGGTGACACERSSQTGCTFNVAQENVCLDLSLPPDVACIVKYPTSKRNGGPMIEIYGLVGDSELPLANNAVLSIVRKIPNGINNIWMAVPPNKMELTSPRPSSVGYGLPEPTRGKSKRYGVFAVQLEEGGIVNEEVICFVQNKGNFFNVDYTYITSVGGDTVTMCTYCRPGRAEKIRWRYRPNTRGVNGVQPTTSWPAGNGKRCIQVSAELQYAGIWEAFVEGRAQRGFHPIQQVVVRACSDGQYDRNGDGACARTCDACVPAQGVCDTNSGKCLCKPGFMGNTCEIECALGYFGRACEFECANDFGGTSCRNLLVCLPEPVGCGCVPPYTGPGCSCEDGQFGTNCAPCNTCPDGMAYCDQDQGCIRDYFGVI